MLSKRQHLQGLHLVALLALLPKLASGFGCVSPASHCSSSASWCKGQASRGRAKWMARVDSAPEGPGLSGWKTNPAVKAVISGRTVSLPGYYKDEDKMLPKWADEFIPGDLDKNSIVLTESTPALAVRITNEEVSWEPFYCRLVGSDGGKHAAAMAVRLNPDRGEMAPRGKEGERVRVQASDPKGNYKDSAVVSLELTREGLGYLGHVRGGGKDELAENPLFLVIKTEAKTFTWRVQLKP